MAFIQKNSPHPTRDEDFRGTTQIPAITGTLNA